METLHFITHFLLQLRNLLFLETHTLGTLDAVIVFWVLITALLAHLVEVLGEGKVGIAFGGILEEGLDQPEDLATEDLAAHEGVLVADLEVGFVVLWLTDDVVD